MALEMKYAAKPKARAAAAAPKPRAVTGDPFGAGASADSDWSGGSTKKSLPDAFGSMSVGKSAAAFGMFSDPLAAPKPPPPPAAAPTASAPVATAAAAAAAAPAPPAPAPVAAPVPTAVPAAPAPVPAAPPAPAPVGAAAVADVEVLSGEEANALHQNILGAVLQAFKGDQAKLNMFKVATRKMGRGEVSVLEFYTSLEGVLGAGFTFKLTKELARVLPDREKRMELLALRQAARAKAVQAAQAPAPAPTAAAPEL